MSSFLISPLVLCRILTWSQLYDWVLGPVLPPAAEDCLLNLQALWTVLAMA